MKVCKCNKCGVEQVTEYAPWDKGWWEVSRYDVEQSIEHLHFCGECSHKVAEFLNTVHKPDLTPVA